jgi:hypothetical protein
MSGKTTELIKLSAESFAYLIVGTQERATAVFHQAKEMGLDIPFPLTYDDFVRGSYYGKGINGFLIDNADNLIEKMSRGVPVLAISLTEQSND